MRVILCPNSRVSILLQLLLARWAISSREGQMGQEGGRQHSAGPRGPSQPLSQQQVPQQVGAGGRCRAYQLSWQSV